MQGARGLSSWTKRFWGESCQTVTSNWKQPTLAQNSLAWSQGHINQPGFHANRLDSFVSDSLTNLSTPPPHLILSVSEPEGECRSTLACSRKRRSGGLRCRSVWVSVLCIGLPIAVRTRPPISRVEKANQMEWPPVPASGQKQRQIHVEVDRRLVKGGSSQGNDASRNHPSTSRRLCLPCLKADGARP